MANYHFTIKSDKRKNGARTLAVKHSEYIDREGKYKNIDEKRLALLSYEDTLTGDNPIEKLPDDERLLYKSPFGMIKQDKNGIHVSPGASPETVAIALGVAKYIYGENLSLSGNTGFKAKAILAGRDLNYRINFSDKQSDGILKNLQEVMRNENEQRRKFDAARTRGQRKPGHGKFGRSRVGRKGTPKFSKRTFAELSGRNFAEGGFSLPTLSSLPVADKKSRKRTASNRSMQRRGQDVFGDGDLFYGESRTDHRLRRILSEGRERRIAETVNEIMTNIQKRQNTFGESHVQYINREAAFKQRGGCMYKSHHLPPWANDSPKKFFAAADKYERANGERYKEIEFALPNELTLEQQKEIVDRFVKKHLSDFYYAYAIHDKIGSMSNGERHPHVHIMICTRKLDELEKEKPRSPKMFFHRANAKAPEKGGCEKDDRWNDKNRSLFLRRLRKSCAEIQNEVLKENGHTLLVDHRSLKAQREEALAEGDFYKAELLDHIPLKPVGPLAELEKGNEKIAKQRKLRRENYNKQLLTGIKYALKDTARKDEYDELKIKNQTAFEKLQSDLNDIVFPDEEARRLWEDEIKKLSEQREKIEVQSGLTMWYADVIQEAQLELMTETERENWQEFKSAGEDLKLWREYRERYVAFSEDENKKEILNGIDRQIKELDEKIIFLVPAVRPVFERLNIEPCFSKAQKIANQLLFENSYTKRDLEFMEKKFGNDVERLTEELKKFYAVKDEYTNQEVYENLSDDVRQISSKLSKKYRELEAQKKKIISKDRAMFIAKDVFTKQGFKKLRLKKRKLQERRKRGDNSPELMKLENEIKAEELKLNQQCSTPKAQAKLQDIAAGILRKNLPEVMRYNALKKEVAQLKTKMSEAKSRQETVAEVGEGGDEVKYKTNNYSAGSSAPATSLRDSRAIADGLGGDEKVAQLIAYSDSKDIAGMDNWSMLSEFEKEKRRAEEAMRG